MNPVGLSVALVVFGLWAWSVAAAPLSRDYAESHIGETATVCGVVASAEYEPNEGSQLTLLDLGKPFPNAIFTVMIHGIDRAKFGTPENPLRGEQICVTGLISAYQGKPVIVLIDPSQLSQ